MSLRDIRARWADIGHRADAANDTVWNDDALMDDIVSHAQEDVAVLLAILDEVYRDDLVSALIQSGHYEPGD